MKKLMIILVIGLLFMSCEDSAISSGRKGYTEYLKENLKDPESLKIYNEEIQRIADNSTIFIVDYGAKNSFGGYVRNKIKFEMVMGAIISVEDGSESESKPKSNQEVELPLHKYAPYEYTSKTLPVMIDTSYIVGNTYTISDSVIASKSKYDLKDFYKAVKNKDKKTVSKLFMFNDIFYLTEGCKVKVLSNIELRGEWMVSIRKGNDTLYIKPGDLF